MAYTPTNWQTGDIVTAEKLNKLENGVAGGSGGVFVVDTTHDVDRDVSRLNATWQEIHDALEAGIPTFAKLSIDSGVYVVPIFSAEEDDVDGYVLAVQDMTYYAENADDYPVDEKPESSDPSDPSDPFLS